MEGSATETALRKKKNAGPKSIKDHILRLIKRAAKYMGSGVSFTLCHPHTDTVAK
jgi:hypothetical protein